MRHFFTLLILFLFTNAMAQDWVWGIKGTGDNQQAGAADIVVDNNGNSVIAGYYQKSLNLDGHSLYTEDDYYSDIFLGNVDAIGHVKWLKSIECGNTYNEALALETDDDKNIYLTGGKNGSIFVSKFDSTGVLLWNTDFGKKFYGYGRDISIDQFNNIYVVGGSGGDFFMAKLNYYGETVWTKDISVNSSRGIYVNALDVDALGNAYFAGTFDFDSIILDNIVIKQKGSAFWGKIDKNGKFIWAKSASGSLSSAAKIELISDNNFLLSGSCSSNIIIENILIKGISDYGANPFIAKFDTAGNLKWAQAAHNTYYGSSVQDLKADYNDNFYLTGSYFTCYGSFCTEYDYYIEKYNSLGNYLWRKDFQNPNFDFSFSIDLDNNGFLYNIGNTQAENFIEPNSNLATNSIGVGKLNTLSTTVNRTQKPGIDRVIYNCKSSELTSISAFGQNIKWYDDPTLNKLLYSGNQYQINLQVTDTLYVTQTINNIESWPKEVIVYYTDLSVEKMTYYLDTLSVSPNKLLSYNWSFNGVTIQDENENFYKPLLNGMYSLEIKAGACSRTLNFEFKRPTPPVVDSLRYVCYQELAGGFNAIGENIIWYANKSYNDTLFVGNQYNPVITTNRKFYVRQTVNGIASYPQLVVVKFSALTDTVLQYGPNYFYATYNQKFKYQWYYEDTLIENANSNMYVPLKNGLYTVNIDDSICNKSLSRYFVTEPKIDTTIYSACRSESFPTITAEGQNLTWFTYNYQTWLIDTLSTANSLTPQFNETKYVYLTQSVSGFSSNPKSILFIRSAFSKLSVYNAGNSLFIIGEYSNFYKYKWYLNNDTIPVNYSPDFYSPNYGEYKIKISLGASCDTIFNYSFYPKFDNIVYVCSDTNPAITVDPYIIRWYSDINLKSLISYSGTIYPYLNGKDTTFYIAQVVNNNVVWRDKIKVIYPALDKLEIINNDNKLTVNNPKPYFRYLWQYNDLVLDSENSTCIPDKEGVYSVSVQAGNCVVKLNYSYIKTSIYGLDADIGFTIYPNPTRDLVSIVSNKLTPEVIQVKLYSGNGQLVYSKQFNSSDIIVDMKDIELGVYNLELRTSSKSYNYKIIKLK